MTTREPFIKILKPGADPNSTDIRDYRFHSNFSMLKYHMDHSLNMILPNNSLEYVTSFAHGLGYVPEFMAYMGDDNGINELPYRKTISYPSFYMDDHFVAYADTTNIYIKWKGSNRSGMQEYYASDYWSTWFGMAGYFTVGRDASNNAHDGAFRFTNINLAGGDTLLYAKMQIGTDYKSGSTSNTIKFKTYGIDEDNTEIFNNPMSRSKTDAYSSNSRTVPFNYGDTVEVDVLSQINEIKARGGWVNGNALGFIFNENSGDTDAEMGSFYGGYGTTLQLIKSGSSTIPFRVIVFKDKIA